MVRTGDKTPVRFSRLFTLVAWACVSAVSNDIREKTHYAEITRPKPFYSVSSAHVCTSLNRLLNCFCFYFSRSFRALVYYSLCILRKLGTRPAVRRGDRRRRRRSRCRSFASLRDTSWHGNGSPPDHSINFVVRSPPRTAPGGATCTGPRKRAHVVNGIQGVVHVAVTFTVFGHFPNVLWTIISMFLFV